MSTAKAGDNMMVIAHDTAMLPATSPLLITAPCERRPTLAELFERLAQTGPTEVEDFKLKHVDPLLARLKARFIAAPDSTDATHFLGELTKVLAQTTRPKTYIGVYGPTGAGKSSAINALLGIKDLLPTNCFRACTATATEVSFNHSQEYRAEIEFLSHDEWRAEMTHILRDMSDENGRLRTDLEKDNDFQASKATLRAVYPQMSFQQIKASGENGLLSHDSVKALNTTVQLKDLSLSKFKSQLQGIIDSKSRALSKSSFPSSQPSLWPLIKLVRIYVKADILENGAVLVDLPGLQDANAARTAVAKNYMQRCHAIWILTPISRACDDKTASDILKGSLRRSLQMHGMLDRIVFVATKADDFVAEEIIGQFDLQGTIQELKDKEEDLESRLMQLKADVQEDWSRHGEVDEDMTLIKEEDMSDHPAHISHKRPPPFIDDASFCKRSRIEDKHKAINQRTTTTYRMQVATSKELEDVRHQIASICILKRNEAAAEAIRLSFAEDMRALDELEAQHRQDQYNQKLLVQNDYEQKADKIPIFCISARAYNGYSVGKESTTVMAGYKDQEITNILRLRRHCMEDTYDIRTKHASLYLEALSAFLNSILMWLSAADFSVGELKSAREAERPWLADRMIQLEKSFATASEDLHKGSANKFGELVMKQMTKAAAAAAATAQAEVELWHKGGYIDGEHVRAIPLPTYGAIARHGGDFVNQKQVAYRWNARLASFLLESRAVGGWNRVFNELVPQLALKLTQTLQCDIKALLEEIEQRSAEQAANVWQTEALHDQLNRRSRVLDIIFSDSIAAIQNSAKKIHDEIEISVKTEMKTLYKDCCNEIGPGCYRRMQELITRWMQKTSKSMYQKLCKQVKRGTEAALLDVSEILRKELVVVERSILTDCNSALGLRNGDDEALLQDVMTELQVFHLYLGLIDPRKQLQETEQERAIESAKLVESTPSGKPEGRIAIDDDGQTKIAASQLGQSALELKEDSRSVASSSDVECIKDAECPGVPMDDDHDERYGTPAEGIQTSEVEGKDKSTALVICQGAADGKEDPESRHVEYTDESDEWNPVWARS